MNQSHASTDIERIVQTVLRRLQGSLHAAPVGGGLDDATRQVTEAQSSQTALSYKLLCPVLSLRQLEEVPANTRELVIRRKCVITPAAADEIRARGWQVRRVHDQQSDRRAHCTWLVMSSHDVALAAESAERVAESGDLAADARRIATHVNRAGGGAVWISDQPYAALLQLATATGIRAILLPCLADWPRAQQQANPNVVVIDRRCWSGAEASRLLGRINCTGEGTAS